MSGEPLRVVCAVPHSYDVAPAQRYRWEQWEPLLRDDGIALEFLPFCTPDMDLLLRARRIPELAVAGLRRYPRWLVDFARAREADVLVIARKAVPMGQPFVEVAVARSGVPFVYDFDDAIFLDPPGQASLPVRMARARWRCRGLCKAASAVLVGNEFLAEFARRHAAIVRIIPTTVDVDVHVPRAQPKPAMSLPVVGWSGSSSTAVYLKSLLPALRAAQAVAPFELLVVGADIDLAGVSGRCEPWAADTEVPLLQEMDVGLMPLDDGPWERGKCGLKALLYQAVGIPAIVSDVGVNRAVVRDGVTGYVIANADRWTEAIVDLVRDVARRRELGIGGRRHVVQEYSARRWAPEVARALRHAASKGRP